LFSLANLLSPFSERTFALAQRAQTRFRFSRGLRSVRKHVLISFCPCPPWANVFSIFKSLARVGQAVYFFISPLPALGKPFIFSIHLRPRWASRIAMFCFIFIVLLAFEDFLF